MDTFLFIFTCIYVWIQSKTLVLRLGIFSVSICNFVILYGLESFVTTPEAELISQSNIPTLRNVCVVHWRWAVHWGDIMSTPGSAQYSGGYYEHNGGYHNECGGYREYTGKSSIHWGFHTNSFVFPMIFPHIYHYIPQCTHDTQCTHDIPPVYCTDIMQGDPTQFQTMDFAMKI